MTKFYDYTSLDEFLSWAKVALDNAVQSPEALEALSTYGYNEARIQEGISLREMVVQHNALQKRVYGKQFAATETFEHTWKEADQRHYRVHRRLAKLVTRQDKERRKALGLNNRKKQSYGGWYQQAEEFYINLLDDSEVVEALARFMITQQQLEQGQAMVQQVAALKGLQEQQKTEAQKATQARNVALAALREWLTTFREVARLALSKNPEHLESLQLAVAPEVEMSIGI